MGESPIVPNGREIDKVRSPPDGSWRLSPRMSLLLIGGVAFGGLTCMCVLVAGLALWRAGS